MSFVRRVERLALAVPDLDAAQAFFEGWFGAHFLPEENLEDMGIRYRPFRLGESTLELLQATRPDSPVARFLEAHGGPGVHHITFEVDDLDASIRDFERNGAKMIEGCPRKGAHGRIAFFHPETTAGVLIELCEL